MTPFKRKLARIEAALNPPPSPSITLIDEPADDDDEATWATFHQELEEAHAKVWRVVVCRGTGFKEWPDEYGCKVLGSMAAGMYNLSLLPSKAGRKSAAEDFIQSLQGSALGLIGIGFVEEEDI